MLKNVYAFFIVDFWTKCFVFLKSFEGSFLEGGNASLENILYFLFLPSLFLFWTPQPPHFITTIQDREGERRYEAKTRHNLKLTSTMPVCILKPSTTLPRINQKGKTISIGDFQCTIHSTALGGKHIASKDLVCERHPSKNIRQGRHTYIRPFEVN